MKILIFVAVILAGLTAAIISANAESTIADDASATRSQQTGSYGG